MAKNNRRVLLIQPPFYRLYKNTYSLGQSPLSLSYLAGAIKKKTGWQVTIYNSDFFQHDEVFDYSYAAGVGFQNYLGNLHNETSSIWQEIRTTIQHYCPTVVGISAMSQNFASACVVASIAKEIDKDVLVVVGGPHPSMVRTEILKHQAIDIGVFGEGEETIVDILSSIDGAHSISAIPGIVYRGKNGFVENPDRKLISDLDSLLFPINVAQDVLKDYEKYPKGAFKSIFTIRGCPNNCSFCGSRYIWSRRSRFRSVANIIAEIKEIQKSGVNYIRFDDDTFGVKKDFIHELCSSIRRYCPGLRWSCEIHVSLVDPEVISLMKRAGCIVIQIGVESGNNKILEEIKKGISIEDAFSAARLIKKNRINLEAFFIVGFPQETETTLEDTINAIMTFPCNKIIYSIFTPYPGTKLFEYCKQEGIVTNDFDISLLNHQSPKNYFCPNIPKNVFLNRLRQLEKELDRLNSRRQLKRYFSYEGYLKMKEMGLSTGISRLLKFCKMAKF